MYWLSKARVQLAKKQFSNLTNEYEITLDRASEVIPVRSSILFPIILVFNNLHQCEDERAVPRLKYNFMELSQLESVEKDAMVGM